MTQSNLTYVLLTSLAAHLNLGLTAHMFLAAYSSMKQHGPALSTTHDSQHLCDLSPFQIMYCIVHSSATQYSTEQFCSDAVY